MPKFNTIDQMPLSHNNPTTLKVLRDIAHGQLCRSLLLYGSSGSGKSTLALELPVWFQCARGLNHYNAPIFIDVPNNYNANSVLRMCRAHSLCPTGYTWIILDEVDKSSDKAIFNKLHNIIDGIYSDKIFVLTANQLSLIPPGIISRCVPLEIKAPDPETYLAYAQSELRKRGVHKSDAYVLGILQATGTQDNWDCRKYEQVLERL